jgi:predicted Zn-dependent peptidase
MKYEKKILKNGLRVILIPMPSLESAVLTIWVKTGSRFEEDKIAGVSHFLEHMVFKGSKRRPSAKAVSEEIDSIGAETNAGTSKEWTNFYIRSRSDVLERSFDILSDIVLKPLLKSEEIEKEKGVILEEIAMYEDTPMIKIYDLFDNAVFKGSSLARDIAGSKETVKSLKRDDFVAYRNNYYYPENMVLTLAGGFNSKKALEWADKYFGFIEKTGKKPLSSSERLSQSAPEIIVKKKKTDQAHLIVGFKGEAYGWQGRYAEAVLATILGGGMSSRMFIEVREKRGLAYSVKTSVDHALDNGSFFTYAGVPPHKVKDALKIILNEYYSLRYKKSKITKTELLKAKEYLKGHLALSLESTRSASEFFALEEIYLEKPRLPEEVFEMVDKVSADDIYEVASRLFKESRLNIAAIGPLTRKILPV